MYLRLRTNQATTLYAFPTLLCYLKKGEVVADSRYQRNNKLLRDSREHAIIDLVPFYPDETYSKSKRESIVKEPKGLEVLARGLRIVYKWLCVLKASRFDISLNNNLDNKGTSLIKVIKKALNKQNVEKRVCY